MYILYEIAPPAFEPAGWFWVFTFIVGAVIALGGAMGLKRRR